MVEQITEYKTFNKPPYLLQQFVDQDIHKLIEMSDRQFNELEAAMIPLFTMVWLDYAEGVQLDVLGIHLNYPRAGMDDLNYRNTLRLVIIISTSGATHETLIEAVRILFNPTFIHYQIIAPAKVFIEQDGSANFYNYFDVELDTGDLLISDDGSQFVFAESNEVGIALLEAACPSGVGLVIVDQFSLVWDDESLVELNDGSILAVDVLL